MFGSDPRRRLTGSRAAAIAAAAKTKVSKMRTPGAPKSFRIGTPGTAAMNPASVPSSVNRAFRAAYPWTGASSSRPGWTSIGDASRIAVPSVIISGTSAPRVTRYSFESTKIKKASGKSHTLLMLKAINGHSRPRPTAATTAAPRFPPRLRSINGPSSGATTAKGAKVNSRYSSTLLVASWVGIEKKSESANEMVTRVSPANIST